MQYTCPKFSRKQLTVAKKIAVCRFYRDPSRKVDSACSKTVITLIFYEIKTSKNKFYPRNLTVTC